MRRRSSWAVSLGLLALIGSWLFGSQPAAVVGVGFVVAGVAARVWARLVRDEVAIERHVLPGERIEGADLVMEVRAVRRWGPFAGSLQLRQKLGPYEQETRVRNPRTVITFPSVIRGRHRLGPLELTLTDPLGLERVKHSVEEPTHLLIRPRIPTLTTVFSSSGTRETGALRSAFRQPTGFEIHAVRDYVQGEPLRSVHWPSTAHRGRLMVKEVDDAPREDITVVLDLDPDGVAGPLGASSFDAAVRAVGAIALAHVLWGRRVTIVGTASAWTPVHVRTRGHDWELALDALAAAEPVDGATIDRALHTPASPVVRAREIVVVTGRRPGPAAEALLELRRSGTGVSIVAIAAETYAGLPRSSDEAALTRVASQGIHVAIVSADLPLEVSLAAQPARAVGA